MPDVIRRGLVGTSFRGGFVRPHVMRNYPSTLLAILSNWTFLKVGLAQAAPLSAVGKSSHDCSGRDRRS